MMLVNVIFFVKGWHQDYFKTCLRFIINMFLLICPAVSFLLYIYFRNYSTYVMTLSTKWVICYFKTVSLTGQNKGIWFVKTYTFTKRPKNYLKKLFLNNLFKVNFLSILTYLKIAIQICKTKGLTIISSWQQV